MAASVLRLETGNKKKVKGRSVQKGRVKKQVFEKVSVSGAEEIAVARATSPSPFEAAVLQFVTSRLPFIYLSSLVVATFYCQGKKLPEKFAATTFQTSLKLAAYFTVLAFILGILMNAPLNAVLSLGWFYNFLLIWTTAAYYNLHITGPLLEIAK